MNYLSMVQRLHSEAARQGTTPATVVGATGFNARLVSWIQTAYEDVQSEHETWLFRRAEFSEVTVSGTSNYSASDWAITDLGAWKVNPNPEELSGVRLYSAVADEQDLEYIPWDYFRSTYKFGSFRSQSGRPTIFSIKPDMSMELWPIPDAVYTVNGEYYMDMQTMALDADIPILPDYHMAIVWKALMYYGAFEGAPEVYTHGQEQYEKLLSKLEINQLDKITYGPPLI